MEQKQHCSIGLLAHVDAGKTTLSEALLFCSGARRSLGRVDHRETDQSKTPAAELIAWANERLARHAEPLVTVTISASISTERGLLLM